MNLPDFFDDAWLSDNRDTAFVQHLRNAASQLEMQIEFGGPDVEYSFDLTEDDHWGTVRSQFRAAKAEAGKLEGADKESAEAALQQFRDHYKEYVEYLE